jgi:PKD repeat protein
LTPRSDGLTYACSDLEDDFTHPAAAGARKVAEQLRAFFIADPTASPWFLKAASGAPRIDAVSASPPSGDPGVRVAFAAAASDPDGVREYVWTFADGTYAYGATPHKTFTVAGQYPVRLAVIDRAGNASHVSIFVSVGDVPSMLPGAPRNFRITRPPGAH